jgi:hypothetical protein
MYTFKRNNVIAFEKISGAKDKLLLVDIGTQK